MRFSLRWKIISYVLVETYDTQYVALQRLVMTYFSEVVFRQEESEDGEENLDWSGE